MWLYAKMALFTVAVPGTVAVLVPYLMLAERTQGLRLAPGALHWLGLAPLAAGAPLLLWSIWLFAKVGRGTPAPFDPPRLFVAVGAYRYVRNPMYLGVALMLVGESLLFGSFQILWYAAVCWVFVHLFVLLYEEPTLRRKFGASYEEYLRQVPRWVPALKGGLGRARC